MQREDCSEQLSSIYVVIGHERYPEDGEGIVGVFADQDDAQDAVEDPDDWSSAFITKEEVQ